jgi:hypothetical protein
MTHKLQLRTSRDGGRNYTATREKDLGVAGDFNKRAVFRRLGQGYELVFEISDTSPYRGDLIAASIDAEPAG